MFDLQLSSSEKAEFLEAARLAGYWLVNSQYTLERPWGQFYAEDSADHGRFLEKTCPSRDYRKPAGVWLTGVYLCGLCELVKAPVLDKHLYEKAIKLGARYLKTLQCFDSRWPKAIGGFHEIYPGHTYSAPRDAATGAFALLSMYLKTGEKELLERALQFGEWYSTSGSDNEGYPWDDFDLPSGIGTSNKRGDWQSGGALIYYQLWKITKESKWKNALKRVLDVLEVICNSSTDTGDTAYHFHGDCTISIGNDDFANTVLLIGYKIFGEKKYLNLMSDRLLAELSRQDARGAFPGYGGTFVTALELLEVLDFQANEGVKILEAETLAKPLLKAARFSLSLQEKTNADRFMLGGVYGQSNYAHARDVVHGRDAGYAMHLWLRLGGFQAQTFAV